MKKLKNKVLTLTAILIFISTLAKEAYADVAGPPVASDGLSMIFIIAIILGVCLIAFIVLKRMKHKK
jgi:subtilase family serine protease